MPGIPAGRTCGVQGAVLSYDGGTGAGVLGDHFLMGKSESVSVSHSEPAANQQHVLYT